MTANGVIIGIGNETRADDGAGRLVARRLAADPPPGWDVREADGDPASLMALWEGYGHVVAVDAVLVPEDARGAVLTWDARAESLPWEGAHPASSHAMGLAEAIALARALGRLPPSLHVVGIGITPPGFATGLSPAVATAVTDVATRLRASPSTGSSMGKEPSHA